MAECNNWKVYKFPKVGTGTKEFFGTDFSSEEKARQFQARQQLAHPDHYVMVVRPD